jgi:hypothetical protein
MGQAEKRSQILLHLLREWEKTPKDTRKSPSYHTNFSEKFQVTQKKKYLDVTHS